MRILILLIMFTAINCYSQVSPGDFGPIKKDNGELSPLLKSGPVIKFDELFYDAGDVVQGDKLSHTFKFRNLGNEPLVLSNVQTTCGCTVAEWPKEPIVPGAMASITAIFNTAGKVGKQNKVITITSNATETMTKISLISNIKPPVTPEPIDSTKH